MGVFITGAGGAKQDWKKDGSTTYIGGSDTANYTRMIFGYYPSWTGSSVRWETNVNAIPAYAFNCNVRISDETTNCNNMFAQCHQLDSEVVLGNNATDCQYMFSQCRIFNQPITIPNTVNNCSYMFNYCMLFNQPVTIPNGVYNCAGMFSSCQTLNQNIYVPKSVNDADGMFMQCWEMDFNKVTFDCQNYIVGKTYDYGTTSFSGTYYGGRIHAVFYIQPVNYMQYNDLMTNNNSYCVRYTNNTLVINNNCYEFREAFAHEGRPKYSTGAYYSNSQADNSFLVTKNINTYVRNNYIHEHFNLGPIRIGNNVTNCAWAFSKYQRYNYGVTIGQNVIDCSNMFNYCRAFNQPVTIPDSVTNCSNMFNQCVMLNLQRVKVGNNVKDLSNMFYGAGTSSGTTYNITVPATAQNCQNMVGSCRGGNIYFKNSNLTQTNVKGLVNGSSTSYQKNIFCTNAEIFTATSAATSITGQAITWAPILNGYYNASYNIYIYNNMPSGI